MFIQSFDCPNCGASLQIDANNPFTMCLYCHSTIHIMPGPTGTPAASADIARLNEIAQALNRMLERTNEDAFVIFEERTNRKFVQFAGSVGSPLCLDLPSQTLNAEEMQRATALFSSFGVASPETHPTYTDAAKKIAAGQQVSFNLNLGKDVQLAAQITLAIFQQVYHYPTDFQLVIAEN